MAFSARRSSGRALAWCLPWLLGWPLYATAGEVHDEPAGEEELEADDAPDEDDISLEDEFALLGDELVVDSAARHRQKLGESPSAVTVITREDIETSGATTIPDLLRLVPGLDVVVVTPFMTAIGARAHWTYENNLMLVLVDGREANDALLGQPAFEVQPISLEDIERIEVIRGPAGALYGANSFAGVVSITTRGIGPRPAAHARISGGEHGQMGASAFGSARIGDFGLLLSAGGEFARSFVSPAEEGKRIWKLRALGEYRFEEDMRLKLEVDAGGARGKFSTGAGTILGDQIFELVRLAFESRPVRAHLYWSHTPTQGRIDQPISLGGFTLAEFAPTDADMHSLDGEVQWTLPTFYEPLMFILGATGRLSYAGSDSFLDAATFSDPDSDRFQQAGAEYWEWRLGGFLHAEYAPAAWVTVSAGLRYDYSSVSEGALSPRLAVVFEPAEGHYLRVGAGRSFRKPAVFETRAHIDLVFPEDSPTTEDVRWQLRDLMTRTLGNPDIGYEKLSSAELGYLAVLLDGQLRLGLDLYYAFYEDMSELTDHLTFGDLANSTFRFENVGQDLDIFGAELSLRFEPVEGLSLLASWAYKEIWFRDAGEFHESGDSEDQHPRNLFTVGGRYRAPFGLLGSLYAFFRSEFTDRGVDNPAGLLAPYLTRHQPNSVLLLGRLGYQIQAWEELRLEAGLKLFLPISFEAPHWVVYERSGGVTPEGRGYGGEPLGRVLSVYLEGTY